MVVLFITVYWFYELGAARLPRAAARRRGQLASRSPRSSAATTCTRPTARGATAPTARAGSARSLNRQDKLYAHLSVDYINNMMVAGGRYACGNVNSRHAGLVQRGPPARTAQLRPDRRPDRVHPRARATRPSRSATHRWASRSVDPIDQRGPDVQRLGRRQLQAGARRDAVPGLLVGRVRGARPVRRPERPQPRSTRTRPRSTSPRRASRSRPPTLTAPADKAFVIEFDNQDARHAAQHRDQGLVRRGQVHRRDLQRRRDAGLPGAGARRRELPVPVHGPPEHDDGDAHGQVMSPPASSAGG